MRTLSLAPLLLALLLPAFARGQEPAPAEAPPAPYADEITLAVSGQPARPSGQAPVVEKETAAPEAPSKTIPLTPVTKSLPETQPERAVAPPSAPQIARTTTTTVVIEYGTPAPLAPVVARETAAPPPAAPTTLPASKVLPPTRLGFRLAELGQWMQRFGQPVAVHPVVTQRVSYLRRRTSAPPVQAETYAPPPVPPKTLPSPQRPYY